MSLLPRVRPSRVFPSMLPGLQIPRLLLSSALIATAVPGAVKNDRFIKYLSDHRHFLQLLPTVMHAAINLRESLLITIVRGSRVVRVKLALAWRNLGTDKEV